MTFQEKNGFHNSNPPGSRYVVHVGISRTPSPRRWRLVISDEAWPGRVVRLFLLITNWPWCTPSQRKWRGSIEIDACGVSDVSFAAGQLQCRTRTEAKLFLDVQFVAVVADNQYQPAGKNIRSADCSPRDETALTARRAKGAPIRGRAEALWWTQDQPKCKETNEE